MCCMGGSSFSKRLMISEMTIGEGYAIVGDSAEISLVGISVTGLGDMNDDGYDDIAISVMTSVPSRSNVVYVIYGNGQGDEVLLSSVGNGIGGFQIIGEAGYYTGFSISGGGDVNGDGSADLVIGTVPYPGTEKVQSSIIVFGSREGSDVFLSSANENEEVGRILLVEGGGFIVSGIGDINHDGIADVLLSASYSYLGESNAYIVTYPTDMTSPPTLQPSSSPSTRPSSRPSSRPSTSLPTRVTPFHSYLPSLYSVTISNNTFAPTKPILHQPSVQTKKTMAPLSIVHTEMPSIGISTPSPSPIPSQSPSKFPTELPSRTHTPTRRPSFRPTYHTTSFLTSHQPTSSQTSPSTYKVETIVILTQGHYVGPTAGGNEAVFEIVGSGMIEIQGGGGIAHTYVMYPASSTNTTVLMITDFDLQHDVIDLQQFPTLQSVNDISFSDNPLTMLLTSSVKIICPSIRTVLPNQLNLIFAVRESSTTSTSNGLQAFLNPTLIVFMALLFFCCFFVFIGSYCQSDEIVSYIDLSIQEKNDLPLDNDNANGNGNGGERQTKKKKDNSVGLIAASASTRLNPDQSANSSYSSDRRSGSTLSKESSFHEVANIKSTNRDTIPTDKHNMKSRKDSSNDEDEESSFDSVLLDKMVEEYEHLSPNNMMKVLPPVSTTTTNRRPFRTSLVGKKMKKKDSCTPPSSETKMSMDDDDEEEQQEVPSSESDSVIIDILVEEYEELQFLHVDGVIRSNNVRNSSNGSSNEDKDTNDDEENANRTNKNSTFGSSSTDTGSIHQHSFDYVTMDVMADEEIESTTEENERDSEETLSDIRYQKNYIA